MQFLSEVTAPSTIKQILKTASSAKMAVAFWGLGAVERLGIGRGNQSIKIICNLESGACNPNEIRSILELSSQVEVRTNPRLHAKVYWTPHAVIIGSSNASSNGLAVEGRELSSWAEANVLLDAEPILSEMSAWFDDLFEGSNPITESDLEQAEEIWRQRRLVSAPGIKTKPSLIETFRKTPDHPIWDRTKITFWQDHPSTEAHSNFAKLKDELSFGEDYSFYEGWGEQLGEGDWVLDFFVGPRSKPKYQGIWRILPPVSATPALALAVKSNAFSPEAFGTISVTKDDRDQIASVESRLVSATGDERNKVFLLRDVVSKLDAPAIKAKPDIRAFEAAMMNIYTEAASAGYRPTAFLSMLQSAGALETARRLVLSPKPSDGFSRLWELGRLDLTVESLVLKEPWINLFDADLLTAAKRRLGRLQAC